MSERKVLNKYYPPDYDPAKIPRLKRPKDRQYVIRVMAPFNLRCKTCGNYIYKGTKFNARQETVQDKDYLGLRIYRFYIKCTKCVAEITFLTDPANQDYEIEHGATRNFEAEKLLDEQQKREEAKRLEDESNPMKMLEIRTRDSKREMEMLEVLEELKEQNDKREYLDINSILKEKLESEEERLIREKKEDEEEMKTILNKYRNKRIPDITDHDDLSGVIKKAKLENFKEDQLSSSKEKEEQQKKFNKLGIVLKKKETVGTAKLSNQASKPASKDPKTETVSKGLGLIANYGSSSDSD